MCLKKKNDGRWIGLVVSEPYTFQCNVAKLRHKRKPFYYRPPFASVWILETITYFHLISVKHFNTLSSKNILKGAKISLTASNFFFLYRYFSQILPRWVYLTEASLCNRHSKNKMGVKLCLWVMASYQQMMYLGL